MLLVEVSQGVVGGSRRFRASDNNHHETTGTCSYESRKGAENEWPSSIVVKMGRSCGQELDCQFREKGRAPAASTKTHDVLDEAQKPTASRTPAHFLDHFS